MNSFFRAKNTFLSCHPHSLAYNWQNGAQAPEETCPTCEVLAVPCGRGNGPNTRGQASQLGPRPTTPGQEQEFVQRQNSSSSWLHPFLSASPTILHLLEALTAHGDHKVVCSQGLEDPCRALPGELVLSFEEGKLGSLRLWCLPSMHS